MAATNFTITATELGQFRATFKAITSNGAFMSGEKAKTLMLQSNLPREILGKIWELADHDCDGNLTSDEFAIAMYLVSVCKGGGTLPVALPPSLTPPLAPDGIATAVPPSDNTWVVTNELKAKYDTYFAGIDKDHDGFVSGEEVRPLFIASKVPQPTLAHIWTLCDTNNVGKLNREQFALAMYLIAEKVRGKDPPTKLTPQMMPPSCRNQIQQKQQQQQQAAPFVPIVDPLVPVPVTATAAALLKPGDYSAIKELDTLHGEVEQLGREKLQLKQELVEKQDAIQQKKSEIDSLESQLEQCSREQKELDAQKQLANQQLAQLEQQKNSVTNEVEKLQQQYQMEFTVVQQLRDQLSQQEEAVKAEELGLQKLRQQLKDIQEEEQQLKAQVEQSAAELKRTQEQVRASQASVSQAKQRVAELKEQHRSITANLALYPSTQSVDMATLTPDDAASIPTLESDAVSHIATAGSSSPVSSISGFSEIQDEGGKEPANEKRSEPSHDPFSSIDNTNTANDPFSAFTTENAFDNRDQFGNKDSFDLFSMSTDPFKQPTRQDNPFETDPFQSSRSDPFSTGVNNFPTPTNAHFDPFSADPFANSTTTTSTTSTGFDDAFATNWGGKEWDKNKTRSSKS